MAVTGPDAEALSLRGGRARQFSPLLLFLVVVGVAYEAVLVFTPLLQPYRFPIPYAVPIFDSPFALVAIGIAYLCLERHRLRQDSRSALLGITLWLTALLAIAHISAQPDYPGTPGANPGVAPYFFFLSYLGGFAGIGLAAHAGDRPFRLMDRSRVLIAVGVVCVAILIVIGVLQVRPILPTLVMKPGRLTPFTIWVAGVANGLVGAWALWGARRKALGPKPDPFAGFLLVAGFVWLLGLTGFLIYPYRYAISWYLAGLARPIGVGIIFVGLLREQVWLYQEARGRLRDLEGLHDAGQALVTSLDPHQIVQTIAARALAVTGADAALLFRLDSQTSRLHPVSHAGRIAEDVVGGIELPVGQGAAGRSVAERRPVWSADLSADASIPLADEVRTRLRRQGLKSVLAVPLHVKTGEVSGALSVFYGDEREFADTDLQLLSAFGAQASVALENARSFDELALRARHDAALQDFARRLLEATNERAILDDAVRVTAELVSAELVSLFLLEGEPGTLRLQAGVGWSDGVVGTITIAPSAESLAGYAFLNKTAVDVDDLAAERRFSTPSYVAAEGVRAGVAVPLGVREQPVGVLAAYYREPHRLTDEEQRVLTSLAHQTALALDKVRLYAELQANLERLKETQAQLIQADKLTALGTLLSGMAHELNNPLSTIQLSVQLMKRQPLPDPVRKRMDAVEEECERASRIIRDLLVFARRKAPERRRVDLNKVINGLLSLQAPEFDLNRIRVVADLETLPPLMADPHQLQQVFLNLFTNARYAMKTARGQGTLTVRSARRDAHIVVHVEDDGPGVAPEHLGRIFDPFFTTKGTGEGTGLGLSLSIGIVEAHGGRMEVENIAGSGARFTVRLPVGPVEETTEAAPPEPAKPRRRGRVLIVDDEDNLRATLVDVFASLGHEVEQAATGGEALQQLEQNRFDVVTLDLRLPDIDGKVVWQRMISRDPALAATVIFMTGDTMSPDTQKFLQEAGRPVLTKPLTIDLVSRLVDEMLEAQG